MMSWSGFLNHNQSALRSDCSWAPVLIRVQKNEWVQVTSGNNSFTVFHFYFSNHYYYIAIIIAIVVITVIIIINYLLLFSQAFSFLYTSPLESTTTPTARLQLPDYSSTLLIMCDVATTTVFVNNLLNAFSVLFTVFSVPRLQFPWLK